MLPLHIHEQARSMVPALDPSVAKVFEAFPAAIRPKLMALRKLIFETAAATGGVGPITETLKWGEPAYLTSASRSGSTIRIGWKKSSPGNYAMYFNCQANLMDYFRTLFSTEFKFEGNRAIVFDEFDAVPTGPLAVCIAAALTYHSNKKPASENRLP